MDKIKLGFVPTRRSIFSAPDAIKYRGLTADRLREIGVDIVDIDDINDEGLLFDDSHIEPIVKKFRAEGVDGIMLCHANFGTEYVCARLARELGLPVLLWGPRDERPEPDGTRLRDSQCGLFATGKVLRRFQVPFTYMTNCRLTDPEFERGVWDFLAVCNVVKTFKHTRILLCNGLVLLKTYLLTIIILAHRPRVSMSPYLFHPLAIVAVVTSKPLATSHAELNNNCKLKLQIHPTRLFYKTHCLDDQQSHQALTLNSFPANLRDCLRQLSIMRNQQ